MLLSGLLRKNKKIILLAMILLDAILIGYLFTETRIFQDDVSTTASMQLSINQDDFKQLLVNTYLTKLIEASNDFYDEYYTIAPIVNYYSVEVKKISSDNRKSYVTFKSLPYLGPHDTIGIDEITFSADYLGNVELEKFNHIMSYHLPENLKDLEKKRVPGKYDDE
jgi:hypothetical protein